MTSLVIVESPNKVRSIAGYLGDGYVVDSSVGHIRDLPRGADEVPAAFKGETWARLGVNIDSEFEPIYVVSADKKSQMTKLKKLLKDADELVLATDEDREGEAIAWHLLDELKPKVPVKRIVFNEITKDAIQYAIAHPRDVDMDLVDAQETRRILDRLYGYEVSPVLWKKVMSGLSAGRVQSVATRLVVERERERMAFRIASYWDLEATFDAGEGYDPRQFPAKLFSVDGKRIASGSNFDNTGQLTSDKVAHLDESRPARWPRRSPTSRSRCARSSPSPTRAAPTHRSAPRRCSRRRRASSASAPPARCRSPSASTRAATSPTCVPTRRRCRRPRSTPPAPRSPSSTARPTCPRSRASTPARSRTRRRPTRRSAPQARSSRRPSRPACRGDERRLYELIWKRTIASQMRDAKGNSVSIRIGTTAATGEDVVFGSSGRTITFYGFLKAYVESHDDSDAEGDDQQTKLPNLSEGQTVTAAELGKAGHETKPPSRFTEATLISELETREIGRPSTYASIVGTIQNRGYVYKKGTALVPAWIAFSRHPADGAALRRGSSSTPSPPSSRTSSTRSPGGREERLNVLTSFWTGEGEGNTGLKRLVENLPDIDARGLATFPLGEDDRPARRPLRPVRRGSAVHRGRRGQEGADPRQRPRRPAARRADARQGQGAAGHARRHGEGARQAPRDRPRDHRQERPLRPLRHRGAARGRQEGRQAAHREPVRGPWTSTPSRSTRPCSCSRCRGSSTSRRTASRSRRRTVATAPTSRRAPTPGRSSARSSSSRSPRRRSARSTRSPRRTVAVPPPRRSRSSATTRSAAHRSWPRTAASACTSPTASTTPRCARTTRSRR